MSRVPERLDSTILVGRGLIGIDGDQGSGKSTLAAELCQELGGVTVSLDDYVTGGPGSYLAKVREAFPVEKLRFGVDRPIIIEGVVLLKVLRELGVQLDALVFCRREILGAWPYASLLKPNPVLPRARLTREIAEYYRDYAPFHRADICVTLKISRNCESRS